MYQQRLEMKVRLTTCGYPSELNFYFTYEGASKSFLAGRLEREL